MKKNSASYTAQIMALYRAMETRRKPAGGPSQRGAGGRLFTDVYADSFLSGRLRLASWIAAFSAGQRWLYRYMQRRLPGALGSGIARTRYIDDLLERKLADGVRQVILLGAGFDTRALRLPALQGVNVLEIDQQGLAELFRQRGIVISQPTVVVEDLGAAQGV